MTAPLDLSMVKAEPVEWLWAERIARKQIHFIAGRPDVGKGLDIDRMLGQRWTFYEAKPG